MEKIYYNAQGWVCQRYPYDLPIENENLYIEVSEQEYEQTMSSNVGMAWRVVKGKLEQAVYNNEDYSKSQIEQEIATLKNEIAHIKEDVEQVELFGIERQDYERKKARCVEIILRLRELEARLKEMTKEGN